MKKSIVRVITDIVLTALFLVLLGLFATGLNMHQVLGKVILGVFILHIVLNFKWLKGATINLFSKGFPGRIKIIYILNLLIFAGVAIILVTGPAMSDAISEGSMSLSVMKTRFLHTGVTYITLGLIGIHIGLLMNKMSSMFKNIWVPSKKVAQTLTLVTVIICLSLGIFGLVKGEYFRHAKPVMSSEMSEMFQAMESDHTQFETSREKPTDTRKRHKREYPAEKNSEGKAKVLYGFLSLVFFATIAYILDKLFCKTKKKK